MSYSYNRTAASKDDLRAKVDEWIAKLAKKIPILAKGGFRKLPLKDQVLGIAVLAKAAGEREVAAAAKALIGKVSSDRTAAGIRPGTLAPINYIYDHPSRGELLVSYSGDGKGWYVLDNATQRVLASGLMRGLTPTPNRNAMRMIQKAVDKELG